MTWNVISKYVLIRYAKQSRCWQGSTDSQGKFENLPKHLRDVIDAILSYLKVK